MMTRQIMYLALGLFVSVHAAPLSAQNGTGANDAGSPAQTIIPFTARYKASANGLTANATRSLTTLDDGVLLLSNELQATVLGQEIARLRQRSEFHVNGEQLISKNYTYQVSGITSDQRSIEFDWQSRTALSREDDEQWRVPLTLDAYDPLSHQFALSQTLRLHGIDPAGSETPGQFAFDVVDGDKIETHLYQFLGEEVLQTPLGTVNSVKLERVRENSSSRSTLIWLAPDWDYLLARIEQVNGSGLQIKLELESATVGERVVTALP